jgi:DNA-directed RNA polymerase subunit RPC12/RpoP
MAYLTVDCSNCGKAFPFEEAPSPKEEPELTAKLQCPHCGIEGNYAPPLMTRPQGPEGASSMGSRPEDALERLNRNARKVHEADKLTPPQGPEGASSMGPLNARTNTANETKSEQTIFGVIAVLVGFLSLVVLGLLVMWIWNGWLYHAISLGQFLGLRKVLAILVVVYAIWCFWRLIENVALRRVLADKFVPELIAFSVFWVLAPPIWFFVEYFAVASDWLSGLPQDQTEKMAYLKIIKDYADYASKIWAGVLALLLGLITLKKGNGA